jgi:hypothetical protein
MLTNARFLVVTRFWVTRTVGALGAWLLLVSMASAVGTTDRWSRMGDDPGEGGVAGNPAMAASANGQGTYDSASLYLLYPALWPSAPNGFAADLADLLSSDPSASGPKYATVTGRPGAAVGSLSIALDGNDYLFIDGIYSGTNTQGALGVPGTADKQTIYGDRCGQSY